MDNDDFSDLLDLLREPEVVEATRGDTQTRSRAITTMIMAVNRTIGLGSAWQMYGHRSGGIPIGVRVVVGLVPNQRKMTAYCATEQDGMFFSHGVYRASLAEALLCGYFVSELTDTPIPDTFV